MAFFTRVFPKIVFPCANCSAVLVAAVGAAVVAVDFGVHEVMKSMAKSAEARIFLIFYKFYKQI